MQIPKSHSRKTVRTKSFSGCFILHSNFYFFKEKISRCFKIFKKLDVSTRNIFQFIRVNSHNYKYPFIIPFFQ